MSQEAAADIKRTHGHTVLLRKSSTNKMALKEKIVQIYEAFFQVS